MRPLSFWLQGGHRGWGFWLVLVRFGGFVCGVWGGFWLECGEAQVRFWVAFYDERRPLDG